MKILITGGTGLVGSAIKDISILYPNYTFIFIGSKDCDLLNYNKTLKYFKNIQPEYVIHLAGNVGGLYKNMNYKVEMFEDNILINLNVIKASYHINVKKLISCLSTCIFPDNISYPINENVLHNGPPHYSNDTYAYAKRMLEIQSNAYNQQYGTNFVTIIPTNVYGPNDNFNILDGHIIPALIHKCYIAKNTNTIFNIAGTGKPLRQFIYSEDLAKLIMWCLESYNEKTPIILSNDDKDEISIGEIATLIANEFNYNDYLNFDETKQDGQFKKTADNSKLRSLNPNFEFTNIKDGLKKTIEWFISNYDNCRK